ncbi:uncharacterized protein LOC110913564 [Helianthus annuus]|uniref:uncharacterized protein LOC110913564 n=1 Tax=Helianthus annuus TaxID=4232 RepID=UPI000B8F111A|nr:uncharacterized protein LOC110913564 [Helianthus annuus]
MVARILHVFHACSGLRINLRKSNLFGVGVEDVELASMAEIVGCVKGGFPFKYLGIPLGANMNRVSNWDPIISIFRNRLSNWKARFLSIGGRVVLIKSVLESLPIYFFSIFKVPVKVVVRLESLMKNFLWGGSDEVRKTNWVAWDYVTRSIKFGGLGISKLKTVNDALLVKWLWRFRQEEESLWRKVIMACHGNSRRWSFFPCNSSLTGMPPRRPPRRNTHTNHERSNSSSNETPVDPNIINVINQVVAGLLPNLVAQTAEAVIQQTRHPERTNTNPTSGGETRENTTNNITYSIDIWISKFQKQKPKSFSHATNPVEARNWIAHVEKNLRSSWSSGAIQS